MSEKAVDKKGRWRSKTVAFRMSPEENENLDMRVKLSGLTKQQYLVERMLEREVVVHSTPRVYKLMRDQLTQILDQLYRISEEGAVTELMLETIQMVALTLNACQKDVDSRRREEVCV